MTRNRLIAGTVFLVYALGVLAITIIPFPHRHHPWEPSWHTMVHLVPFVVDKTSMVLNIFMFVPFGFLLPLVWPWARSMARVAWLGLLASTTIELIQLLFLVTLNSRRTVDINDLIANTGGAVIGVWLLHRATRVVKAESAASH